MQILIIGSGVRDYILAKYLSKLEGVDSVVAVPRSKMISEFADCYDVEKTDVDSIVEFVSLNNIDLAVTFDEEVIATGIVEKFNDANLSIFAPMKSSARIALSKAIGKKFMYKTKIPTPRFAVIDKEVAGVEYLKNAQYPVVIKNDLFSSCEKPTICKSFSQAKRILELKFLVENNKVIIEDFIEGKEAAVYFLTDGYNAIPLVSTVPYKYSLEGKGGAISCSNGVYAPAQNIDFEKNEEIKQKIVYPALREMSRNNNPYIGILGVQVIITPDDKMYTIDFKIAPDDLDTNVIFSLLNTDFVKLANAAIVGELADDYEEIDLKKSCIVEAVLSSPNYWKTNIKNSIISGLEEVTDEVDIIFEEVCKNKYLEYETCGTRNMIVASGASTLGNARKKLYENVDKIGYTDKKYLKDIAQTKNVDWV